MTLIEALTLTLGPAIAKSILKMWLKDRNIALDVASSLVDLIKSKTTDALARNRGNRQFEEIGEKVALGLLPLFELEGAKLDEGGRTAVALAVANTLEKSGIDPALLAEQNLEPTALAKHLMESNPKATRDFSEAETELYRRIIFDSCQDIVDIASQLPSFTERTFAEVLKREGQILSVTEEILDEVRQIREGSQQANIEAEAVRFETEYRRSVIRKLDVLELFGADVSRASGRHRLSVAYVTLSVEKKATESDESLERLPDLERLSNEEKEDIEEAEEEDNKVILSVDKALAGSRRLLIRGLAGSGKTTLLQWIAVRSASEKFEGELSDWNNTTAFFIRLRQFVESGLPAPEEFPKSVAPAIAGTMPKGWVHNKLESGRAIVLIDGVDEMPETQRSEVRNWVKDLVETYPESRFFVTSRPSAVEEGWMEREGFDDAELQPMDISDILAFIDHWHEAVREELQDEEEKTELTSLRENLKEELRGSRQKRELATNPLLCAMLCALHRDRRRQLPSDRVELYDACCHMLIERRDIERKVELRDYPRLSYRQKRVLLEDLAYWLLTNDWPIVPKQRAAERIARELVKMQGLPQDVISHDVMRLFVDRSGIVREPVPDQVDFTHRTFQEFLAAHAALDERDTGVLVRNAHNDQWREVVILAAGLASESVRKEIINGLIERGDRETKNRHQLHLLAVACLETSVKLEPDVKEAVQARLEKLVPPKNITEAKALASAGELAVPYLIKFTQELAPITAACVRTLAIIGGEAALDALEKYGLNKRQTVVSELVRAWDSFDRNEYARRVLSRFLEIAPHVDIKVSSLEGIQVITDLTSLNLWNCKQLLDLSPLAGLTNLTSLSVGNCDRVSDLSPLAGLTNLTSLHLTRCEGVSDLSPLAGLSNLTSLYISNCKQLLDLSPLAGLSKINSLRLGNCERVSDLSPLAGLTNLTSLHLTRCEGVSDLSPLAGLSNLTSLNLSGCRRVSDLSPLAGLSNLTSLYISNCKQLLDLIPLAGLSKINSLRLGNCERVSDLRPLAGLSNLTSLNIWNFKQQLDLNPLKELSKLNSLRLSGCEQVSDLISLAGLTNLTSLDLSGCERVSDLIPLAGLTNLTSLDLSGCERVSDLIPLAGLTNLTSLDLSGCERVSDLIPLAGLSHLQHLWLYRIQKRVKVPKEIRKYVRILR